MNHDCRDEFAGENLAESRSLISQVCRQLIRLRSKFTSERGLMGWAAMEAAFPMLPVELVLIPLTRLRPSTAVHLTVLATIFSGVGAIYSYALGSSGESFMHWDGLHAAGPWLDYLITAMDRWGEGLVLFAAFLPAPLSIVSMGAGLLHIGLIPFLVTVMIARGLRFYLVTSLTIHFDTGKKNVRRES